MIVELLLSSVLNTEAGNQPTKEIYKVCDVVINRSNRNRQSVLNVLTVPHQFKHWRQGNYKTDQIARDCLSPDYKPTYSYTHFSAYKGRNRFR